jgi:hypothetical protein
MRMHVPLVSCRKAILKLVKRIVHRGPDWSSLHADGENYLAHQARRLRSALGARSACVCGARRGGGRPVAAPAHAPRRMLRLAPCRSEGKKCTGEPLSPDARVMAACVRSAWRS